LSAILLDILRLPQRVLPKTSRSGRAARRRATAATKHRLHSEAQRLRQRYSCPDPNPKDEQHMQMSADTMGHTTAQGGYPRPGQAASAAADNDNRPGPAATTDESSGADTDVGNNKSVGTTADPDSDDECGEPFPSLTRRSVRRSTDPDSRAAQRSNYLVQCGLTRKAAQVLHSTTQIADLRTAAAQETMLRLHPRPPSNAVLPTLPGDAPPAVWRTMLVCAHYSLSRTMAHQLVPRLGTQHAFHPRTIRHLPPGCYRSVA
jgi:hypothetical protein